MLLSTLKCVSHLCVYKSRPRKRPQGFRQQYSYGPPAGWPSTCSNISRNAGRDGRTCYYDDGLQALPRRGLKSRILHHSTNQGSLIYLPPPIQLFRPEVCFWHFSIQERSLFHFSFFRRGLTCHLIMCVGWKVDSSNRFLVIKRYVKIFFRIQSTFLSLLFMNKT